MTGFHFSFNNAINMKQLISLFLGLLLGVCSMHVFAQTERLFRADEVSESALVEALLPAPASAEPSLGLSRSIRIAPVGSAMPAAKSPQASMLITFETKSAELTPKAKEVLDVLGRALQSDKLAQLKFSIEGHADPRGSEEANLLLSQQRAAAVVQYLAEHQNINESRLIAVGKGQSEPMNLNNLIAPENRRVTVKTVVQ